MNRYNHIAFNPKFESITSVINRLGATPIWSLSHIVPISEYEYVAVFEAWDGFAEEDKEFGRIPVSSDLHDCSLTPTKETLQGQEYLDSIRDSVNDKETGISDKK